MARYDGALRTFDDPARKPGEPWVMATSPAFHERIERELEELRGEPYVSAAVACQAIARIATAERNQRIAQAVAAGANVAAFAEMLGLSRQHVYAISQGEQP